MGITFWAATLAVGAASAKAEVVAAEEAVKAARAAVASGPPEPNLCHTVPFFPQGGLFLYDKSIILHEQ